MAHPPRYLDYAYVGSPEIPRLDITLPPGLYERADEQSAVGRHLQQLTELGVAFCTPSSERYDTQEAVLPSYDIHIRPGRLHAVEVTQGEEARDATLRLLNAVTGTLIARHPYPVEQPRHLQMEHFAGTGNGDFMMTARVAFTAGVPDSQLRVAAETAMQEVSLAMGLEIDSANRPSAVVVQAENYFELSPRPKVGVSVISPAPEGGTHLVYGSELNDLEDPLVVLAGITAMTTAQGLVPTTPRTPNFTGM